MTKRFFIILLLCLCRFSMAQTVRYGSLIAHVDSVIDGMPRTVSGGEYVSPDSLSRHAWKIMFQNVLIGQYLAGQEQAKWLGYQLVCFTDTTDDDKCYYLLERLREPGSPHWGLFAVNPAPLRPNLVIQSPHPKYDMNTGKQGVHVFQRTGARVFFLSGTHRCNSGEYSLCDGSTSVCGNNERYRLSDQPHTVMGTFQANTEVLEALFKDLVYVQLHGFAKRQDDPDIIMSNTHYGRPPVDYLVQLRDALHGVDASLTFKIAHLDNWTYLTSTTNMQGRYINGVSNPCHTSAKKNSGRFLHLEQAFSKLRDSAANWDKMAQALMIAFPEQPSGVEDSEVLAPMNFALYPNYPNPFNHETILSYQLEKPAFCVLSIFDILGREVKVLVSAHQSVGRYQIHWDGADAMGRALNSGIYFYRLQADNVRKEGKMLLVR